MKLASTALEAVSPGRSARLLLAVDSLDVGGAERHVADLALALKRKGYRVDVACSVAGALSPLLEKGGVPAWPLAGRLVKRRVSLPYARGLRALIKERGYDLVHAHIYASAVAAALATLGTGVPLVITEHTEALWQNRVDRMFSGWASRRARCLISVSSVIRERLVERDGVSPERITVIPNGVVLDPEGRPDAPPELPVDPAAGPLVGIVARLRPEKGVAHFVKAAARVAAVLPEVNFLVVGDGPLKDGLPALAEQLGLRERMHFLGLRSDVQAIMEALDVLAVPSLSEGAPLVTLEAMAAGVPIVASAVGGIPDQVRHGEAGLLVPPGDPVSLGDALLDLLRDPARAHAMGEAGRRRATSEFSHETMVRRVEAVYRTALGRTAVRGGDTASREEPGLQAAR